MCTKVRCYNSCQWSWPWNWHGQLYLWPRQVTKSCKLHQLMFLSTGKDRAQLHSQESTFNCKQVEQLNCRFLCSISPVFTSLFILRTVANHLKLEAYNWLFLHGTRSATWKACRCGPPSMTQTSGPFLTKFSPGDQLAHVPSSTCYIFPSPCQLHWPLHQAMTLTGLVVIKWTPDQTVHPLDALAELNHWKLARCITCTLVDHPVSVTAIQVNYSLSRATVTIRDCHFTC